MISMGIDPGGSGAIVVIGNHGVPDFVRNSGTESDLASFVSAWCATDFAIIEKVGAMPKQGVSSTFKFGQSYGFLRGLLIANRIAFEEVTPQKWQKEFGLVRTNKSESGTDKKNRHKAKAQQLFPGVKVTHANADALLIAEYCRRTKTAKERT